VLTRPPVRIGPMSAMRRIALLVLTGSLLAEPALAASLANTSDGVGAATVATPRCTSAALTVVPTFTAATVSSVTISGIPAGCGSTTLQVAVNNGATSSTGSAAVPAGGGSVAVTLAVAVTLTAGVQVDAVIVGP
jgi:hypothetical protein